MSTIASSRPSVGTRASYGLRVMERAFGVLKARATRAPARRRGGPFNTMFHAGLLPGLNDERRALQRFDLYLFDVMNSGRLQGQVVFEYGTLLRAVDTWDAMRVLDVGTGRSTFPRWMSAQGSTITTFDLAAPVERLAGGFQERVDAVIARRSGTVRAVAGDLLQLPFPDASFDLVTSISVLEHLDTQFPERRYVPYDEQRRRLQRAIDEMIRVTAPGGRIYITSECCDYDRATSDSWRGAYYYIDGPALSAAWPVRDVPQLFYDALAGHGCTLLGGVQFDPADIAREDHWTYRGPFFSGFSVLAQKGAS